MDITEILLENLKKASYTTPPKAHFNGRIYNNTKAFHFKDEANAFMEANPEYVLLFEYPIITLARKDDEGMPFDSPLNVWKKKAQAWDDDHLHLGELHLYFDNEEDWKETWQALNDFRVVDNYSQLASRVMAFSEKQIHFLNPKIKFSIAIHAPDDSAETENKELQKLEKILNNLNIPFLRLGHLDNNRFTLKTPLGTELKSLAKYFEIKPSMWDNHANKIYVLETKGE